MYLWNIFLKHVFFCIQHKHWTHLMSLQISEGCRRPRCVLFKRGQAVVCHVNAQPSSPSLIFFMICIDSDKPSLLMSLGLSARWPYSCLWPSPCLPFPAFTWLTSLKTPDMSTHLTPLVVHYCFHLNFRDTFPPCLQHNVWMPGRCTIVIDRYTFFRADTDID